MSRRPGSDRAAANQNTIKQLLKLEGNKICADCKRNKHPRWASWNLGIFICIRCSGIHRGMGTHISRVKSVDLDAWTDEQLQSVLKWGNVRANKYWEAKLAPGHVPSEAKLENYIRTKYEAKRWVMDGPMPDPSTLGGEEDDMPLNVVKEKATMERASSQRAAAGPIQAPPARRAQPNIDLFGDDPPPAPPARPSTTDIPSARQPPPPQNQAAKQKPGDSLLGLDFFGGSQSSGPARPSSAAANPGGQSRPDLKQSILSLYASAPKPQAPPAQDRKPSVGGVATHSAQKDAFGGLSDAFDGLNFGAGNSTISQPASKPSSAYADLGSLSNPMSAKSTPAPAQMTSPLAGGGFFDTAPKQPAPPPAQPARAPSNRLNFAFTQSAAPPPKPPVPAASQDLFDDDFGGFSSSEPPQPPPPSQVTSPPRQPASNFASAFNLSNPAPSPAPASKPVTTSSQPASSAMFDPWSSVADTNAWSTPDLTPAPAPQITTKPRAPSLGKPPTHITPNDIGGGWGAPMSSASLSSASKPAQPTVAADEDFGGWTSAATPGAGPTGGNTAGGGGGGQTPSKGFGGGDDLFSNVWE